MMLYSLVKSLHTHTQTGFLKDEFPGIISTKATDRYTTTHFDKFVFSLLCLYLEAWME